MGIPAYQATAPREWNKKCHNSERAFMDHLEDVEVGNNKC